MNNSLKKNITECLLSGEMLQPLMDSVGFSDFKQEIAKIDVALIESYFRKKAQELTRKREVISKFLLFKTAFSHRTASKLYLNNLTFENVVNAVVGKIAFEEFELQKKLFVKQNISEISCENDVWRIYYQTGPNLRYHTYDFTTIKCAGIRQELKFFMLDRLKYNPSKRQPVFRNIVIGVNFLTSINSTIHYFSDITEVDVRKLLFFLEHEAVSRYNKGLSVISVCNIISGCKQMVNYLCSIDRNPDLKSPIPYDNFFANYSFHNMDNMSKRTKIIPECVITEIDKHVNELSDKYRICYSIFKNTGLRLSEVMHLTANCLTPSRYKGLMCLKYMQIKTFKSRKKRNLPMFNEMLIPNFLTQEIKKQMKNSENLRAESGEEYIFISKQYTNRYNLIAGDGLCDAINRIIVKYDIRDENGELWNITTKQFRKTIAVALIESGATNAEVAYWLGHLTKRTSMKYYAEVTERKLAELNEKFFAKKFNVLLNGEQLQSFSEEQRRLLYVDFKMEYRRVELGFCVKLFADGGCTERNRLINCVGCKNLCTGKNYLRYWQELMDSQQLVVDSLLRHYAMQNITDFGDFREFQCESKLLEYYRLAVEQIGAYSNEVRS